MSHTPHSFMCYNCYFVTFTLHHELQTTNQKNAGFPKTCTFFRLNITLFLPTSKNCCTFARQMRAERKSKR